MCRSHMGPSVRAHRMVAVKASIQKMKTMVFWAGFELFGKTCSLILCVSARLNPQSLDRLL